MTGTIRNNTSKARTSQVNRERAQNRRATSVPTGCDSWEQRKSVGRRQFSYTDAPHGRACHRNASEFNRRDAAKSRRNRHRERTDKMEARWEICDSEPHNPTPPSQWRRKQLHAVRSWSSTPPIFASSLVPTDSTCRTHTLTACIPPSRSDVRVVSLRKYKNIKI